VAQEAATSTEKAVDSTAIANSLLWAITGNGLEDTSYLYGTIHLIGKDDFFLTKKTEAAFEKSKKVTFEINMEDMMDINAQMGLMMKAFMNDNNTLSNLLEEKKYLEVKKHFEDMGMGGFIWGMMERIKPMFLSIFGSMDMSGGGGLQTGEMKSYEMEFMQMAKADSKEMGGLETAEYQMSMFDSIPYKAQAEMLYESIKAENSANDQLEKMVKLYKKQDLNAMMKMFEADEEGVGKYEDLLLVGRNKNWIPVMKEMMTKQITFFAVGAGHLGGEYGVVNLLKKEGYELIPMNQRSL
jgi:uncharacterized protein YbaP (TraB family)